LAVKIGCTWPAKATAGPHPQTPPVQDVPEQTLPHAPQFDASELVSTQLPPQTVFPAPHVQAPLTQLAPLGQALPQPPQFDASVDVFVHVAPHAVIPAEQPQTPPEQPLPVGQTLPQAPQFAGSVLVSTHDDPQTV
jgi:hypothetical protein